MIISRSWKVRRDRGPGLSRSAAIAAAVFGFLLLPSQARASGAPMGILFIGAVPVFVVAAAIARTSVAGAFVTLAILGLPTLFLVWAAASERTEPGIVFFFAALLLYVWSVQQTLSRGPRRRQ